MVKLTSLITDLIFSTRKRIKSKTIDNHEILIFNCSRSFKPDFVLVRQNLRDAGEDYKNLLLGLMYGGVPSVNNLTAIYNFQVRKKAAIVYRGIVSVLTMVFWGGKYKSVFLFQDKPWVFAHLLGLQRHLGRENFPLIEQTYYPNHREMVSVCFNYLRYTSRSLTFR